jgi:hypothetical protein
VARRPGTTLALAALALALAAAAGCSHDMRDAQLSPKWTHASALEVAKIAVEAARQSGGGALGGPLTPRALFDPTLPGALAGATVRYERMTWPAPGSGAALPFLEMARDRPLAGVLGLLTLQFAYGFVADLVVFFPFGYSHRAVLVEVPAPGLPAMGNGYFISDEGMKVLFYDDDDRWLWRANRMDDIAEAFEFLAREDRAQRTRPEPPPAR